MKQYSIVLPLSLDDYDRGLRFVDYLIDFDFSKQTTQKVELISQTPYIKTYHVQNYLPDFIQQLVNTKQLSISERRLKIDNGDQRVFNFTQFPAVEISLTTTVSAGEKVKHDQIDVVTEQLDYFKGYEKDVERRLRESFGIMEFNNWKRYCPNLISCQVVIQVTVAYGEESNIIEQYLYDQCQKYIVYFYKSMLLTYKNWNQLSDSELFRMNKQVLIAQNIKSNSYNQYIYNALDLLNKTNYKELKKQYLNNYTKSQTLTQTKQQFTESRIQPTSQFQESQFVKKNLSKKKAGFIYKKGDGPIDYNWNQRYVVLDGETLIYFKDKFDKVPRGVINLRESYISAVSSAEDREHSFYIESQNKFFYFSGEAIDDTEQWRDEIFQATLEGTPRTNDKRQSISNFAINTYLLTDSIPQELLKYPVINRLDDLQKEWLFRKFRNGVKIYEKPLENRKFNKLFIILGVLILILIFTLYYYDMTSYLIALVIVCISTYIIKRKQKLSNYYVYARLICDIDSQKAFDLLKNMKNKQIFDSNFVQINKLKLDDGIEFQKKGTAHFIINPIRQKKVINNPQIIQLQITRYRFILKDSHSFVVDICKASDFQMTEIYEIQGIPKVSGKGIINYYCHIGTKLSSSNQFHKYLSDKAQNLSLISQTIDEQRFEQFHQSIVNELSSSMRQSVVSMPIKSFEEQLQIIQQLKNNCCTLRGKKLEERVPGYRRYKEGGIECFNKEEIKAQEGLVLDLMRSAGRQLFEGRNIISVSLPVRIFEARSMIERICDWWGFIPIYLEQASSTQDEKERFKLVVTMVIAGFYIGGRQKKPFNPILGETFQGNWQDGTQIFIEHTSHHPPISHFYINHVKNKYRFYGHYEYQAALRYNAVIGHQQGDNIIEFSDGQKISYQMPPARISGLLFGARILEWYNTVIFKDIKNNLLCEVKFSEGAGMLIGRGAKPTDYFEGTLFQQNKVISKTTGSWLETIEWDNIKYWDIEKIDPAILVKNDDPLPSDCKYRTDLIQLANGNHDKAQDEKTRLEIIQRRDRKLRQDYKLKIK